MSRALRGTVSIVFAVAITAGASNSNAQDTPPTTGQPESTSAYDLGNPFDVASLVVQALKDRNWETMAALADNPDDILELQADPGLFEERIEGWRSEAIEAAPVPITEVRWVRNSTNRVWAFMGDIDGEVVAVLRLEREADGWVWEDVNSLNRPVWEAALNVEGF